MLNELQRQAVFDGILKELGGQVLSKHYANDFLSEEIRIPCITLMYISEGVKRLWATAGPISVKFDETLKIYRARFGGEFTATLQIGVVGLDQETVINQGRELFSDIYFKRLNLNYETDEIKMLEILDNKTFLDVWDDNRREHLHIVTIDIKLVYMMSMFGNDPAILEAAAVHILNNDFTVGIYQHMFAPESPPEENTD